MSIELRTYQQLQDNARGVESLVEDILPKRAFVVLYGATGTGKTFVMKGLAHSVSSGRPWMGRQTEQGAVLWIAAEGAAGLRQRTHAWCVHHGVDDPGDIRYVQTPVPTDSVDSVSELLEELRRQFTGALNLIVVDTLAANASAGFSENDAMQMGLLIDGCKRLILETGCTVVLIHHTGWLASRERGSSALRSATDVTISLEKAGKNTVKLTIEKAREFARPDEPIILELVPVADALVAVPSTRTSALTDAQIKLLTALQRSSTALNAKDWEARSGVGRSSFFALKPKLLTDNLVAINDHRKFYITPAGLMMLNESEESTGRPMESDWTRGGKGRGKKSNSPSVYNTGLLDSPSPTQPAAKRNGRGGAPLVLLDGAEGTPA